MEDNSKRYGIITGGTGSFGSIQWTENNAEGASSTRKQIMDVSRNMSNIASLTVDGAGSFGGNVTVTGNLTVAGTQTTVNSTQVEIGDQIILLNASNASGDAGIYVSDADNSVSGSLLYDTATSRWMGGVKGSEKKLVTETGCNANIDVGAFDLRAQTLTADGLTSGRLVFAGANGVLSDDSDMSFSTDTLTVTKLGAFEAAGAINFANQDMTNVDIDSGAIDGATIGAASAAAGTFTTLTATTSNLGTLGSNVDHANFNSTNVDIDSGAIDGTVIGASSVAAGSFAAVVGTTATFSSTLTANGDTDLGNATSDTITATGRFDSDLVPSTDSARDLGSSALQWAEVHADAGHIDAMTVSGLSALGAVTATSVSSSAAISGSTLSLHGDNDGNLLSAWSNSKAGMYPAITVDSNGFFEFDSSGEGFSGVKAAVLTDGTLSISSGQLTDVSSVSAASSANLTLSTDAGQKLIFGTGTGGSEWQDDKGNNLVKITSAGEDQVAFQLKDSTAVSAILDEDGMNSNSATSLATQQSIKAYVDAQVTAQDLDFAGDSGGALSIDLDSESLTIAGATGLKTAGSGNTLTVSLDTNNMSALTTVNDADTIAVYDADAMAYKKISRANFIESSALDAINIDGGAIDGTVIGASSAAAATVTTLGMSSHLTFSSGATIKTGGNSVNLGEIGNKFAAVYATNVYTGDMHLKNERGDWTIFEESDHLRIRNNATGQTFKMGMTPIEE